MQVIITSLNSESKAKEIASILVQEKAAACVQLLNKVSSIYWWQGKIETEQETTLLIKTTQEKLNRAVSIIRKMHPYEVPEIATGHLNILNKAYQQWLETVLK